MLCAHAPLSDREVSSYPTEGVCVWGLVGLDLGENISAFSWGSLVMHLATIGEVIKDDISGDVVTDAAYTASDLGLSYNEDMSLAFSDLSSVSCLTA